jgi:Cof subfamily protein (haloacid dehalogenase superfamily)
VKKMQDIRLLVLDIDGTILGKSLEVSPAVLEAIQAVQQRGIRVAIATGRMFCSAKKYHQLIASDVPLIAYNGAWIQDPLVQKPHRQLSVPAAIALDILEYLDTEPWCSKLHLHVYHGDQLFVKELNDRVFAYQERTGCQANLLTDLRGITDHAPTKILAVCHHEDLPAKLLPEVRKRYTDHQIHCVQSTEFYVEFTSPVATKGQALKTLTEEILGLEARNVMAIGDNYNDLEMIQYAGLGIAMGNAPAGVQKIADHVTDSIENDGVAQAIAQFLL